MPNKKHGQDSYGTTVRSVTFEQPPDTCDMRHEDQTLTIGVEYVSETERFYTISSNRWAFDSAMELCELIDIVTAAARSCK